MNTTKNIFAGLLLGLAAIHGVHGQNNSAADEYFRLADECKKRQQPDSALLFYEKAAAEYQAAGSMENLVSACNQIGIILTRQDKYDKAKTWLEKALSSGLSSLDSNHLVMATTYISLGVVYNAEENYAQALLYHYKALAIRLQQLGEEHAEVATSYGNIGNVCRNSRDYDNSIAAHRKAMLIREKIFGAGSPEIIESYVGLGNAYREKKEYTSALDYFEKALKNKIAQRGEGHKDLARFYKYISELYYLMENKAQGDSYKAKAEAVLKN